MILFDLNLLLKVSSYKQLLILLSSETFQSTNDMIFAFLFAAFS